MKEAFVVVEIEGYNEFVKIRKVCSTREKAIEELEKYAKEDTFGKRKVNYQDLVVSGNVSDPTLFVEISTMD